MSTDEMFKFQLLLDSEDMEEADFKAMMESEGVRIGIDFAKPGAERSTVHNPMPKQEFKDKLLRSKEDPVDSLPWVNSFDPNHKQH